MRDELSFVLRGADGLAAERALAHPWIEVQRRVLDVRAMQRVGLGGADVLVCKVDARHALVVGRQRYRDTEPPVDQEWVIFTANAENHVIAGEVDFYHDMQSGHLF